MKIHHKILLILTTVIFILSSNTIVNAQTQSVVVSDATGANIKDWDISTFTQNVNIAGAPNLLSVIVDLKHSWINDLEMKIN